MTRVVALARHGGALALAQGLDLSRVIGVNLDDRPSLQARVRAVGATCSIVSLDEVFTGPARETDYHGTAQILGAAARTVGFDLLVCGQGAGRVGPAVAERLALPYLGSVVRAELRDGKVVVHRWETRGFRAYEVALPAMIGVLAAAPPNVAPPLEPSEQLAERRLGLSDVGLSSAELRWRRRFAPRPSATPGPVKPRVSFPDAASLARRLVEEGLVRARSAVTERSA